MGNFWFFFGNQKQGERERERVLKFCIAYSHFNYSRFITNETVIGCFSHKIQHLVLWYLLKWGPLPCTHFHFRLQFNWVVKVCHDCGGKKIGERERAEREKTWWNWSTKLSFNLYCCWCCCFHFNTMNEKIRAFSMNEEIPISLFCITYWMMFN